MVRKVESNLKDYQWHDETKRVGFKENDSELQNQMLKEVLVIMSHWHINQFEKCDREYSFEKSSGTIT